MYQTMRSRRITFLIAICISCCVCIALVHGSIEVVSAETIPQTTRQVETTGTDSGDCTISPCLSVAYALSQSNEYDVVILGTGSFTVTEVEISKSVTIQGGGVGTTTVQSIQLDRYPRTRQLFQVKENTSVTLTQMTVHNSGNFVYTWTSYETQSAVENAGTLAVRHVEFANNKYGAIQNMGIASIKQSSFVNNPDPITNLGIMSIEDSTIVGNTGRENNIGANGHIDSNPQLGSPPTSNSSPSGRYSSCYSSGAAISNYGGVLHLQSSTVSNFSEGAIVNTGVFSIDESTVADNNWRGGIRSTGILTVTNSQIHGNQIPNELRAQIVPTGCVRSSAGLKARNALNNFNIASETQKLVHNEQPRAMGLSAGIHLFDGTLFIQNSSIFDNHAGTNINIDWESGEHLRGGDGGGLYIGESASARIENSTIYSNSAGLPPTPNMTDSSYAGLEVVGYGGNGGGIANFGVLTAVNTLIYGNQTTDVLSDTVTDRGNGGGIWNAGTAYLRYVTITNNDAGLGGGVYSVSGTLTTEISVIAVNTADSPSQDCYGNLVSNGYNIIKVELGCNWEYQRGDITGHDPWVTILTPTRNPRTSNSDSFTPVPSLFNDRVPATHVHCNPGETVDLRGLPRAGQSRTTGGWGCDIGALERQNIWPSAVEFVMQSTSTPNVPPISFWISGSLLFVATIWLARKQFKHTNTNNVSRNNLNT